MPSSHMLTAIITFRQIITIICNTYWSEMPSGTITSAASRAASANLDVIAEQSFRPHDQDQHQDGEVDDEGKLAAERGFGDAVGHADEQPGDDSAEDAAHAADLHDDEGFQQRLGAHFRVDAEQHAEQRPAHRRQRAADDEDGDI